MDDVPAFEMGPEGVRGVRQASASQGVPKENMTELVGPAGVRKGHEREQTETGENGQGDDHPHRRPAPPRKVPADEFHPPEPYGRMCTAASCRKQKCQ